MILLLPALLLAACGTKPSIPTSTVAPATAIEEPTAAATEIPLPPVVGPDPSYKVAAFYYAWYGNVDLDPEWYHWDDPQDISADYYPELGPYSSNDPLVVAQHMAWLREAGVGVIIVSWWGRGGYEERPFPLIMEMAERYGIKVAFHIEPYRQRTADQLVEDVQYLYRRYGDSPAFFRSTASSRYSPGAEPKGMFFVWCSQFASGCGDQGSAVEADYWQEALDEIHALPGGTLLIAQPAQSSWVTEGHFDGLYNYATLHLEQEGGFAWAGSLPPDSLYIPSVLPGFSAERIGDPPETLVLREDGQTYDDQWTAALGAGVEPALMTITSFNEWHEGTMIEPPALGARDGSGSAYYDFGALPADGYLTLTRQWIGQYLAATWPDTIRVRIQIKTTSDWTTLNVVSGGQWIRPELISMSEGAAQAAMESGGNFALQQSLDNANLGREVEMTWDVLLTGLEPGQNLVLSIDRGGIGRTQVTIFNYLGDAPVEIQTFTWGGSTTDRNSYEISIAADALLVAQP